MHLDDVLTELVERCGDRLLRVAYQLTHDAAAAQTSDAVKLSSCLGKFFRSGGEGGGLVILAAGGQAVPEAAEQAAEQVALGAGVPVAVGAAAVVVGAGAG